MFQFTLPRGERLEDKLMQLIAQEFQFTLPRGERPYTRTWFQRTASFQFTLPRGERPLMISAIKRDTEFQFTLPRGERPRGKYSEIFRGFEEGFLRSSSIAVTDGLYSKRRNWVSAYCSSRASNRQKSCVHHLRKQLSFHLPTYENPIQRPLHNARICCIVIDI